MSNEKLAMFEGQKYICVETYKKNGQGVKTPVWCVISDGIIYVATTESSGKVKRIKNNKSVRIVPSNFQGNPNGQWVEGEAFFGDESELKQVMSLRNKKYGLIGRIIDMIVSRKKIVVIGIKI